MAKVFFIFCLSLAVSPTLAQTQSDALRARDETINALRGFNPADVLKGFTDKPSESALQPGESTDSLKAQGLNALKSNPIASDIYQQEAKRLKIRPSPNSPEMQYADTLLENPEAVLDSACYKEKGNCISQSVTKTCEDALYYSPVACKDSLEVTIKSTTQQFIRIISARDHQIFAKFDLTSCPVWDSYCTSANTAQITQPCDGLEVKITWSNLEVPIIKQPTCTDPTVILQLADWKKFSAPFQVSLITYEAVDNWSNNDCEAIIKRYPKNQCILERSQACLEPNAVKIINNFAISRPCWGKEANYQCAQLDTSACDLLINTGCSQTASSCLEVKENRCERYSQTFHCMEVFCEPEKTICPGKLGCADGDCDSTKIEESHDMGEGIARLGALAGVAGDVALNQTQSGIPSIFAGKNAKCRTLIAKLGNCCGKKARLLNCRAEEKELAKAKAENRAFKVGTFCANKVLVCEEEKESWCVFPSQLSSIVQIQGRYNQLKIPFGEAHDKTNAADCRGITPEELERIDFSLLDLKPLEDDFLSRGSFPTNEQINGSNQTHVERLKEEGRAYD